jgi:hypothetical protein
MAKYQRQGTNKYYGAANAGYVSTGSSVDGLAKSLVNAGYKIGEAENLRIDRKKDKAIAKIDELYANGKSFETIQSEIISGKHPELTGKYINATTNYHAGRVKAHEVIKEIETNKDKYDIRNQEMTLDVFYKDFMPDTKAMDSATLLGFTTQFNKYRAKDALIDAENRAAYNTEKKITDGVGLLDDIPTESLKTELPDFIKSLQPVVPNSDGSSNPNVLHTNAETLAIVKRSVLDIIANAKTEDDLDRADILLNTNLGYSKNGSAIGTLNSRKSKDIITIQDELTKKRRNLIINDRQEAEYQRNKRVDEIFAEMYADVEETTADGTFTRKKTHTEQMALRDELEAMGDYAAVANFDKARTANLYVDNDPEVLNQFVEKIYNDDFVDIDEMKTEFNKIDADPTKLGEMLQHYENSQKDDNRTLHTTNTAYLAGSKSILNIVEAQIGTLDDERSKIELALQMPIVERHVKREIYDFELDYFKQNGRKPTNDERQAFMVKLENYIKQIYSSSGATPMGNPNLETFDTQTQNEITEGFNEVDRQLEEEAQEVKNNTVIGTGSDGNEITLGGYVDDVMENLNTMEVPKLRKTIIEGIISEDEKYRQQTLPKIQKYIQSVMGDNFTKANIEMMAQADLENMVIQVAKNLNMTTGNKQDDQKAYQQIEKIFQNLIGE